MCVILGQILSAPFSKAASMPISCQDVIKLLLWLIFYRLHRFLNQLDNLVKTNVTV
jgi:hypothetical protein